MTSYWRSIVTLAVSRVVSELFNVKNVVTLKSGQMSLKVIGSDTIRLIVYGFLLVLFSNFVPKMHRFGDIRLQKCCDLENWVTGPSRSLEMSQLDRAHMISYWCSIVTMPLSCVISEIFNVEKCRDLEIRVMTIPNIQNGTMFGIGATGQKARMMGLQECW